ncbi:MAG: hypothetical protein HY699_04310 [Deltaproteobacteria bacterium]|nr:hypothetical protein [Deltaproteobacteria bacterium]
MKRLLLLLVSVLPCVVCGLALGGCADGGVGGTGISGSATVQGNIQDIVVSGSAAEADDGLGAGFGGVWVSVQGTEVSDVTASDGSFVLIGPIAGDRVIEFQDSGSQQPSTLNVTVLNGAVTTLKDVRIFKNRLSVSVDEVRVNGVELKLDADAECGAAGDGSFRAHLTNQEGWSLTVVIEPDTVIQRVSSASPTPIPLSCADLTQGAEANVRGVLAEPREIRASAINRTKSGRLRPSP